jgi:hypothetical protein
MMMYHFPLVAAGLVALGGLPADALPSHLDASSMGMRPSVEIAQGANSRVGQVNPNRPIRIEITNAGEADTIFSLSQPISAERRAPVGETIAFGSTQTSYLPPPVYLMAYPEETEIAVNIYVLSTTNNVVKVVVGQQLSDIPGGRTLTIEADGSVYVF